jgi:hypothetical protein
MKRMLALGAVLLAVGAGGARGHEAAAVRQAEGGLSLWPSVLERIARPGALAEVTVANRSASAVNVTISPRPWRQAGNGNVAPDRRATLPGIAVSEGSFALAPGAERQILVIVNDIPASGALYGALEVVGVPSDAATRKGVVLAYRVVGAIRLTPAAPRLGLTAGAIKASKGTAVLPVKNTGNTIDPVTGTISVKDAHRTRKLTFPAVKIPPKGTVNLSLGRLQKGPVTAKVTLKVRGKVALQLTKKFTVRPSAAVAAAVQTPDPIRGAAGATEPTRLDLSFSQPTAGLTTFPRAKTYAASFDVTVTSDGAARLSLADGEVATGPERGHLVSGSEALPLPLEARVGASAFQPLDLAVDPLLTKWSSAVERAKATVNLRQKVEDGAFETYRKVLLVTLSPATP